MPNMGCWLAHFHGTTRHRHVCGIICVRSGIASNTARSNRFSIASNTVDSNRFRIADGSHICCDVFVDSFKSYLPRLRVLIGRDCCCGLRRPRLLVLIGRDWGRGRRRFVSRCLRLLPRLRMLEWPRLRRVAARLRVFEWPRLRAAAARLRRPPCHGGPYGPLPDSSRDATRQSCHVHSLSQSKFANWRSLHNIEQIYKNTKRLHND